MSTVPPGEHALLVALQDGVFERPLWHRFLEQLRRQTGAFHAGLTFRAVDDATLIPLFTGTPMPPDVQRHLQERFEVDPLPHRQMREGRVYTLDELMNPADASHRAFFAEVLAPIGMRYHRVVRVTEPSGVSAWLSIVDSSDFRASAAALLSRLVPHLRAALRSFVALERERARASISSDAIGRLNFGWVAVDARCRILDLTPNMDRIFDRTALIRRGRYDRLTFAAPAVEVEVARLARRFAETPESPPRALNLSQDPWMDILVTPAQAQLALPDSSAAAIVYVSGDLWSKSDRCEQLVELFGLLPSEARLAWAIAQGRSIAEAADELGLTIETARNYTKKIYSKTGARRQAELVRIVFTSVLAIA